MCAVRTKSFLLGGGVASCTWLFILYLYYFSLQQEENKLPLNPASNPTNVPLSPNLYEDVKALQKEKYKKSYKAKLKEYENDKEYYKIKKQNFINSINEIDNYDKKVDRKNSLINNVLPIKERMNKYHEATRGSRAENDLLDDIGIVRTIKDQQMKEQGYKLHAFNTLISSRLPANRSIPDTRHKRCKGVHYPTNLPTASIIICFFREDLPTLKRTVTSVINRSPTSLIKEILLIDDTDDVEYHSDVLKIIEVMNNPLLKVMSTGKRDGLIRARVLGARKAEGEVLVFLDSHVEVNVNWLPPLLSVVKENRTQVAMPIIDLISPDTFSYKSSPLVKGGFNWGLHFKWDSIPLDHFADKSNYAKPLKSPTMAGGLFAINRNYFKEIGEYDTGMEIWGGENLEMSFRLWQCGGSLWLEPCSRVGHVFRQRRPYGDYTSDGDSMMRNSLRLAHVWMDDYKENFMRMHPTQHSVDYGDISDRLELREKLQCKNFTWYLENIYPSLYKNNDNGLGEVVGGFENWKKNRRNYLDRIKVRLSGDAGLCIETEESTSRKGSLLILSPCADINRQSLHRTTLGEWVIDKNLCLQASHYNPSIAKCHQMRGNQEWMIKNLLTPLDTSTPSEEDILLYNQATGLCLASQEERSGAYVTMAICSNLPLMKWDILVQ